MDDRKQINFKLVPIGVTGVSLWRAYIQDDEAHGGMGETPEEALGVLMFRHPRKMGVGCYSWISRPPVKPNYEYPSGPQTTL